MLLIQTLFGSDTKILTDDEITEGYFTDEFKKAKAESEHPSWQTEFENELYHIKNNERETFKKALELPQRCRTGRKVENIEPKTAELFPDVEQKGVLLFSRKGDALRFSFTDENGGSDVLSPFAGISLFKAASNEQPLPITESFYPLYEKTKAQSGISAEKTSHSKNILELNSKIQFLKKQLVDNSDNSHDYKYLDKLRKATGMLEALPLYYIRALLDINIDDAKTVISDFKNIVSENYINAIIEKDERILNEIETILLSEQFI